MRKNLISLLGWLAFVTISQGLITLAVFGFSRIADKYLSLDLSSVVYLCLRFTLPFGFGFLAYLLSLKWVVLPILVRGQIAFTNPQLQFYFSGWLTYCLAYITFCAPVLFVAALPGLFPIPDTILSPVSFVWKAIAGLLIYRSVVLSQFEASVGSPETAASEPIIPV